MTNYEKAKKEGIEILLDKIAGEFVSNKELSSFAEKIKEAVERDFTEKIDEITWNYDDVGVNELEKNTAYIKVSEIKQAIEKDNEIL